MIHNLYNIFRNACSNFIFIKEFRPSPKWFSPHLKDLILIKRVHIKFKESGSELDYTTFAALRPETML